MGEDFERRKGGRINGFSLLLEEKNREMSIVFLSGNHIIYPCLGFKDPNQDSVLGDKLLHTTDSTKLFRRNT